MSTRTKGQRRDQDPEQLTLFEYQAKKSRVESDAEPESSDCDPLELSDDKSDQDSNDDDIAVKSKAKVSGDETISS